ncbi:MAG: hypothetical protein HY017_02075 [Betaproteobacteria bacterium]|nr:hypothetical protein [Betaproteobacteria bacterium]
MPEIKQVKQLEQFDFAEAANALGKEKNCVDQLFAGARDKHPVPSLAARIAQVEELSCARVWAASAAASSRDCGPGSICRSRAAVIVRIIDFSGKSEIAWREEIAGALDALD